MQPNRPFWLAIPWCGMHRVGRAEYGMQPSRRHGDGTVRRSLHSFRSVDAVSCRSVVSGFRRAVKMGKFSLTRLIMCAKYQKLSSEDYIRLGLCLPDSCPDCADGTGHYVKNDKMVSEFRKSARYWPGTVVCQYALNGFVEGWIYLLEKKITQISISWIVALLVKSAIKSVVKPK